MTTEPILRILADEHEVRQVLYRYCRGIDRREFELVRACYHPDATDEHGPFRGNLDEFIEFCRNGLRQYERTMHFLGNILIEPVDDERLLSETYAIAFHRLAPRGDRPARDHVVGLRYVDRFTRYEGAWRIRQRTCVFEWARTDPVPAGWNLTEEFRMGTHGHDDFIFETDPRAL
jgi:3-phenylpropionate/cinnamic acid dioxygenase small subunit